MMSYFRIFCKSSKKQHFVCNNTKIILKICFLYSDIHYITMNDIKSKPRWKPNNVKEQQLLEKYNKSKKIKDYYTTGCTKSQRIQYPPYTRDFFIFIQQDPDEYLQNPELMKIKDKINYKNNIEDDINKWVNKLINSGKYAPYSIKKMINVIKSLLTHNRIDIPKAFWDKFKRRKETKAGSTAKKYTPTRDEMQNIFQHFTLMYKTIFLMQLSSFSRIEDIMQIEMNELEYNHKFIGFTVPPDRSKDGIPIRKRISPEAEESLKEYLKIRDKELNRILKFTPIYKRKTLENRLFPISTVRVNQKWNEAIGSAKLYEVDPHTKSRSTITTHALRRYARSKYKTNNPDMIKLMMGQITTLDKSYFDKTDEEIDEDYSEGVKYLLLEKETIETSEKIKKLEEKQQKTEEINASNQEKLDLQNQLIQNTKDELNSLRDSIKQIEENVHIALNLQNPKTQNIINTFKPYFIKQAESVYGRKCTKEELEQIDIQLNFAFNELKKLPADKIIEMTKIENQPHLLNQLKKNKQTK